MKADDSPPPMKKRRVSPTETNTNNNTDYINLQSDVRNFPVEILLNIWDFLELWDITRIFHSTCHQWRCKMIQDVNWKDIYWRTWMQPLINYQQQQQYSTQQQGEKKNNPIGYFKGEEIQIPSSVSLNNQQWHNLFIDRVNMFIDNFGQKLKLSYLSQKPSLFENGVGSSLQENFDYTKYLRDQVRQAFDVANAWQTLYGKHHKRFFSSVNQEIKEEQEKEEDEKLSIAERTEKQYHLHLISQSGYFLNLKDQQYEGGDHHDTGFVDLDLKSNFVFFHPTRGTILWFNTEWECENHIFSWNGEFPELLEDCSIHCLEIPLQPLGDRKQQEQIIEKHSEDWKVLDADHKSVVKHISELIPKPATKFLELATRIYEPKKLRIESIV